MIDKLLSEYHAYLSQNMTTDIGMDPILLPFPLDSTRDLEASIPCYIKPILR
jgi:hypothetical protein